MDFTEHFTDVLLWTVWIFVWFAAVVLWFRCVLDLFNDASLSGWGKAGWVLVLVLLPLLGIIVYLVARGQTATDREIAAETKRRAGSR